MSRNYSLFRDFFRFLLILNFFVALVSRAEIPVTITYQDAAGVGFYDTTPRSPIGGNSGTTLGEQRRNALEAAINHWSKLLNGTVTIDIQATWVSQGNVLLASASPNAFSKDWAGAPVSGRYYPSALANQLAGRDLTSTTYDIQINCNQDWDNGVNSAAGDTRGWYYGLDGIPAGDDFDFYGVMLHEFGHGMGFTSFLNPDGTWANGSPDIFDQFLVEGSFNQPLYTMSQSSRAQMTTNGNLYSFGGNVQAINGGFGAKINTPAVFIGASSRNHLDENTYSGTNNIDELLTPIISYPTHNIGPLAIAIFRDIGYSMVDNLAPTTAITSVTNGQYFNATPTISGTAIDNSSTGDDGAVGLWKIRCALARTSDGAWWDWINSTWGSTTFNSATNASSPSVSLVPISRGTRNWDLTLPNVVDGNYQVQVSAVDQLGQSSPWSSATFNIDSSSPTIAFSPLTNNQTVFNFSGIGGTVSEPSTVTFKIEHFVSGSPNEFWNGTNWSSIEYWLPATGSGLTWTPDSWTIPSRAQTPQGAFLITAKATDMAGHSGENNIVLLRTAPDVTAPQLEIYTPFDGQVFTNNFLPLFGGSAVDSESGVATVNILLSRQLAPGQTVYWTGSSWSSNPTNLPTTYNNNLWSAPSGYSFPSGLNLPNTTYTLTVGAVNNESPSGSSSLGIHFVVDYHPLFVWTAGSYTDAISGNENQFWSNPANWDVGSVPTADAIVIVNGATPDATSVGAFTIYALNMTNSTLTEAEMSVTKLNFSGGTLNGGATIISNGVFNWSAGNLSGTYTIPAGAILNLIGAGEKFLQGSGIFNAAGISTWTGTGNFNMAAGSVFNNTGTFDAQSDASLVNYTGGTSPNFNNSGTFRKSLSTNQTAFLSSNGGVNFNNSGIVDIQTGVLSSQGQFNINNGGIFSGAGVTRVDAGVARLTGTSTIAAGATVEVAAGVFNGTGTLNGPGTLKWTGGQFNGNPNLSASGNLLITGSNPKTLIGKFSSAGNTILSGTGTMNCYAGSGFTNSGIFDAQSDALLVNVTGGTPLPVIVNTGTFKKSGGSNTTFSESNSGMAFHNFGNVNVLAGVLAFNGGGTNRDGNFNAASGSRVEFGGGLNVFLGGVNFTGAGSSLIKGGTVQIFGTNTVSSGGKLEVTSGGTLSGDGMFNGPGTLGFSGGTISAMLHIAPDLTVSISGADDKTISSGTIDNQGTVYWTGAGQLKASVGTVINNSGIFEAQNDALFFNSTGGNPIPVFNNTGTFRKTASTGNTVFSSGNSGWDFNNFGMIDVQSGVLSFQTQLNFKNGGSFAGAGITRIESPGSGTATGTSSIAAGGTVEFAGGFLNGDGDFSGEGIFQWTGGTISGTNGTTATGHMQIAGNNPKYLTGEINNLGSVIWSGLGNVNCAVNSVFNNGGIFNAQNDALFFNFTGGVPFPIFNNTGSFIKSSSTNVTEFSLGNGGVLFNNFGVVNAQTGVLALNAGGTNGNCTFTAVPAARIDLSGGTHVFDGGINFNGLTRFNSGALALGGGTNTINASGSFEIAGGVVSGTGAFQGAGTLSWTGGNIGAALNILPGATLNLNGAGNKILSGTINNSGTTLWNDSGIFFGRPGSTFNNNGLFDVRNDSSFSDDLGGAPSAVFNNSGTFRKTSATGTTIFQNSNAQWVFNNSGLVDIQSGVLRFQSRANFNNGGIFSGAGVTQTESSTTTLTGSSTIAAGGNVEFAGGILTGVGTFDGPGNFIWTGGVITGTNGIGNTGNLLMSGNGSRYLNGQFNNAGTAIWTGTGNINFSVGSIFNNSGLLIAEGDAQFWNYTGGAPNPVLNNSGTIRKTGSTGTTAVANANGGLTLTNSGTLEVQSGILSIESVFSPASTSQLKISLGGAIAGSEFGREVFPGGVSLVGALQVSLTNGFVPTNGMTFNIVGYGSRTGQFSPVNLPSLPYPLQWKTSYGDNALTLSVVQPHLLSVAAPPSNGQFRLDFSGPPANSAVLQTSLNLLDWFPIATNAPFNGTFQFTDFSATASNKFYRVLINP